MGDGRPFVAALVNIDRDAVGSWAERRNIAYTSYTDLSQKPAVYELIRGEVARVNKSLLRGRSASGRPDQEVPAAPQGARPRRPGDHADAQGPARLHRAEVRAAHRRALLGRGAGRGGGAGDVRGRPDRHRARRRPDLRCPGLRGGGDGVSAAAGPEPLLQVDAISVRFGAVHALDPGEPRRRARRHRRHHRAERGGQDDAPQRHQRLLPARRGPHPLRRARPHPAPPLRGGRARRRPHLPERGALSRA